jgi:Predicted nucleoside-diphosphate-sugar epimerases
MESNRSPRTHVTNAPWRQPLPVPTVLSTRSVSTLSTERDTFHSVHVETAAKIARAARQAGIRRFVHVSGIGAEYDLAFALYSQPRRRWSGRADRISRRSHCPPGGNVCPDDAFLTTILRLLRSLPAYPIFGDGKTRLQPAYVDDVAAAIAQILRRNQNPYPVYELAGPRIYSYEELLRTIARIAGLRPVLMRMPFAFWNALAGVAEMLPQPPLTRNQVELMKIDTTASESMPGFRALRISSRSLEDELEAILRQNKPRVLLPWPHRSSCLGHYGAWAGSPWQ